MFVCLFRYRTCHPSLTLACRFPFGDRPVFLVVRPYETFDTIRNRHQEHIMSSAELKKNRTSAKTAFTRARKSLEESIDKRLILKTVERRFENFKLAWQEALKCHERYVATLELEEEDAEDEESWMDELDKVFSEVEVKSDTYLEELDNAKKSEEKQAEKEKLDLEENERKEAEKERIELKRNQEESMFKKYVDRINTVMEGTYDESEGTKHVKCNIDDLLQKLEGCLGNCKEVHQEYMFAVTDETERQTASTWFSEILEDFHKLRDEGVVFMSRISEIESKSEVSKVSSNKMVRRLPRCLSCVRRFRVHG